MDLRDALARLGALPKTSVLCPLKSSSIIPGLSEFWQSQTDAGRGAFGKKATRISNWLESQIAAGAVAEFFRPALPQSTLEEMFCERLLWWPNGKPTGRQVAIISSRIGRQFQERPQWFETLRLATATLDTGDCLVTASGTTTHRFVSRLAELLNLPRVEVRLVSPRRQPGRWFEWLMKETAEPTGQSVSPVYVSPPFGELPPLDSNRKPLPERDLAVNLLADQTWVLSLRNGGNLERLLKCGLVESRFAPGSVRFLLGEGLVEESQAEPLQDLGAVAWYLTSAGGVPTQKWPLFQDSPRVVASDLFPEGESWTWLTHTTRQPDGAWPDEARSDFEDEVLLSEPTDRSPLAALLRILSQEKLIATGAGIRGAYPVVCFSACPLEKLLQKRKWQRHRTRWDFEPFGICVRQKVLERSGAKSVAYGDDEIWERLSEADRPWFQKKSSQVGNQTVDWSMEQEWRVRGDFDLSQIERDDMFVFVPTEAMANEVRTVSRWPVIVAGSA
ncbi:MAG: hypothetical protein O2820_00910 [Planctomycetota bacterium]|nr:hypothetical protein [Planctomycetota bacterium]MDA1247756.1 hypothetical protein [Planctomycetota bacterium]